MRVGVIYCAWNSVEYLSGSLMGWHQARFSKLGGHEFKIAAVSVPFEGFDSGERDKTQEILDVTPFEWKLLGNGPRKETEARGAALKGLMELGVDVVIQVDSDEFYTHQEIERILAFVEARPGIVWFRGSLRNFVFDDKTYLVEPFTPARIHRVKVGNLAATGFWADNNIFYLSRSDGGGFNPNHTYRDEELPGVTIPKAVAWTKHLSWLSNERSKQKIEYQEKRWPSCSFAWDDAKGGLIWNEEHFKRLGQPLPEVASD